MSINLPRGRLWYAAYAILGLVILSSLLDGEPSGLTESKIYDAARPNIDKEPIFIDNGSLVVYSDATREAGDSRDLDTLYDLIWGDLFTLEGVENVTVIAYIKDDHGEWLDRETRTMTRAEWGART